MKKVLIFANGKAEDGTMVRHALDEAARAYVIAADGGFYIARNYGQKPDIIIGDLDSLAPIDAKQLASSGIVIQAHPPEKDETDLELALLHAANYGADWVRIIGALGGRVDQMLANVYLLVLPQLEACDLALVDSNQLIRLLRPGAHHINGSEGDTLSLIPVYSDAHKISTNGLKYPLANESLFFGPARGISNVMENAMVTITFETGLMLVIHTVGRA